MKSNSLKDLDGIRIRRQFLNYFIFILMLIFLFFLIIRTLNPIFDGYFSFVPWLESIGMLVLKICGLSLPFIILSVLNTFFFGKIVCVINEYGIYYNNGFISWEDVLLLKYEMVELGRFHYYPTYITVVCKDRKIEITSAPLYMYFVAKKFKHNIRIRIDKTVFVYVAIPVICAVLCLFDFLP